MIILSYQNLSNASQKGYELIGTKDETAVISEGIFPSANPCHSIHINHIRTTFRNESILIVSQTEQKLSSRHRQLISDGSIAFLRANLPLIGSSTDDSVLGRN